jgi:hypothetical protein
VEFFVDQRCKVFQSRLIPISPGSKKLGDVVRQNWIGAHRTPTVPASYHTYDDASPSHAGKRLRLLVQIIFE